MSFALSFHTEGDAPYTVCHHDYDAKASPHGQPYTSATIHNGNNAVSMYLAYGERLVICPAPVAPPKPDDELEVEVTAELVGAA